LINHIPGSSPDLPLAKMPVPGKEPVEGTPVADADVVSIGSSSQGVEGATSTPGEGNWDKVQRTVNENTLQAAEFIDRHSILKTAIGGIEKFFKGIKAFPKFIYPTITGATESEKSLVMGVMDRLPLKDVNSVKRIEIHPELPKAAGLAYHNPTGPLVKLSRQQMQLSDNWAKTVTIHETGHTKDFETALFGFFGHESKDANVWGKPPHISEYSKTNHWEDFAESYANYHTNPDGLKEKCPDKFARLQELEKNGILDRLIDRKAFRETGRFVGEFFDKAPIVRNGLNVASYALGFLQVAKGIGELQQAKKSGDLQKKMDGTMDIAAGACFASKLFCIPGLAIDGAKHALDRAIEKGEITSQAGNALVQNTVGAIGGPIAAIANWARSKMGREPAPKPEGQAEAQQNKVTWGSIAKATSIGVGGAAGSVAGGIIGPYTGLLAGFSLAGPIGGAIGLLAGAIAGITLGNRAGGSIGTFIGNKLQPQEGQARGDQAQAAQ
jgi:hypothetical protein